MITLLESKNIAVTARVVADHPILTYGIILKLEEMRNVHVEADSNIRNVVQDNLYYNLLNWN